MTRVSSPASQCLVARRQLPEPNCEWIKQIKRLQKHGGCPHKQCLKRGGRCCNEAILLESEFKFELDSEYSCSTFTQRSCDGHTQEPLQSSEVVQGRQQ